MQLNIYVKLMTEKYFLHSEKRNTFSEDIFFNMNNYFR
jgi:hypothetical protein